MIAQSKTHFHDMMTTVSTPSREVMTSRNHQGTRYWVQSPTSRTGLLSDTTKTSQQQDHLVDPACSSVRVNVALENWLTKHQDHRTRWSQFGSILNKQQSHHFLYLNHQDPLDDHVLAHIDVMQQYLQTLWIKLDLSGQHHLTKRVYARIQPSYKKQKKNKKAKLLHPRVKLLRDLAQQDVYDSTNFQDMDNDRYHWTGRSHVQAQAQGIGSERELLTYEQQTPHAHDFLPHQKEIGNWDQKDQTLKPISFQTLYPEWREARVIMKDLFLIAQPQDPEVASFLGKNIHFITWWYYSYTQQVQQGENLLMYENMPSVEERRVSRRVKRWSPSSERQALMNYSADPEDVPIDLPQEYPMGVYGLDIYNDVQTINNVLVDSHNWQGYWKGVELQAVSLLQDREEPLQYRPGYTVSGRQIPGGGSLTRGFYYFSRLENLVQNEVQKREQFISIERGSNDWDIDLVFTGVPSDRVKRDRMVKIILTAHILNTASLQKEKVSKDIALYLPEGVHLERGLAELVMDTTPNVHWSNNQEASVLYDKKQLKAIRQNKHHNWSRNGQRNDHMLLSNTDKNTSEQGKEILKFLSHWITRDKSQDALWQYSQLYWQFTSFSQKRQVLLSNVGEVETVSSLFDKEEEDTGSFLAKVYTPNLVSYKNQEMGYKLCGNRIERTEELSWFIIPGAYLKEGNRTYSWSVYPPLRVDSQSDAPIVPLHGDTIYQDGPIYAQSQDGVEHRNTREHHSRNQKRNPQSKQREVPKLMKRKKQKLARKTGQKLTRRRGSRIRIPSTYWTQEKELSSIVSVSIDDETERAEQLFYRNIGQPKRWYQAKKKKHQIDSHHSPDVLQSQAQAKVNDVRDYWQYPSPDWISPVTFKDYSAEYQSTSKVPSKSYVITSQVSGSSQEIFLPVQAIASESTPEREYEDDLDNWMTMMTNREIDEENSIPAKAYQTRVPHQWYDKMRRESASPLHAGQLAQGPFFQKGLRVTRDAVEDHLKLETYFGHWYQDQDSLDPKRVAEDDILQESMFAGAYSVVPDSYAEVRHQMMEERRQKLTLKHNNYETFLTTLKVSIDALKEERHNLVNPIIMGYGAQEEYIEVQRTGSQGYWQSQEVPDYEVHEDDELEQDQHYDLARDRRRDPHVGFEPCLQFISPEWVHRAEKAYNPGYYPLTPYPPVPQWRLSFDVMSWMGLPMEIMEYRLKQDRRFQAIRMPNQFTITQSTRDLFGNKSAMTSTLQFRIAKSDYTEDVQVQRRKLVQFSPQYHSYGRYRLKSTDTSLLRPSGLSLAQQDALWDQISNNVVYQKTPLSYKQLGKQEETEHHSLYPPKYPIYEKILFERV